MKKQINLCLLPLLLIFLNILKRCSMQKENTYFELHSTQFPEESCDADDAAAMTLWYTQVFRWAETNRNTSQQIVELNEKLHSLEVKMDLSLKRLNDKIEQLQQRECNAEIVIQRRMDGSVDFLRSWADYKLGFGNSSGEFFIGLEKLHKLTNSRPYELLVVLEDWENDRRYARYDQFVVGSEAEKYALKHVGKFSGTAGDSLTYHLGQKFSTRDEDNGIKCASAYTGAWWYNSCHQSNLNGRYLKSEIGADEKSQGVHWKSFKGFLYSLKFVEMIIRPN